MGSVTFTVLEGTIAAFIVWRVVGVGWMLVLFGWRSYRERQRLRHQLFAEELAFRIRNGLYPSEGLKAFQAVLRERSETLVRASRLFWEPTLASPSLRPPQLPVKVQS